MGVVRLQFRAAASHVRTARLVAVTVARRAGLDEDASEAVRQAIGEACATTMRHLNADDQVTLTLDDAPATTRGPGTPRLVARLAPATDDVSADDSILLAVLTGMTDSLSVEQDADGGRSLCLAWWG